LLLDETTSALLLVELLLLVLLVGVVVLGVLVLPVVLANADPAPPQQ
jgi:hypothetical protein